MPEDKSPGPGFSHEDVRRLFGDIPDWKVAAILETGAGIEELEEVAVWVSGADDVMGEERKTLSGRVAAIYDILISDEPDEAEDRPGP